MAIAKSSLRRAGVVAAVVASFACFAAASASAAPLVWTVNSAEGSISSIESGSNQESGAAIKVGGEPNSIAIAPNGKRAVVTNFLGDTATVVELATRTPVGTVTLPHPAERVAISPSGKVAYVTDQSDESVYVINVETAKGAGSFVVGPDALAIAFSPDGTRAYIGTEKGIAVVDTATEKVVGAPIDLGGPPQSIVFTPDGKTAYATAPGVNGIAVINAAPGNAVHKIPLPAAEAADLAMSPDGLRLYASTESTESVTVVNTAIDEQIGTPLKVGKDPKEIALTPDGLTAYVAVEGEGTVQPIATATNTLGSPIKMPGKGVAALVVAPDQSPTAAFTTPLATAAFPTIFDGSASTDPDGTISSYDWAFGEGAVAEGGPTFSHTYAFPGTFNAQLSVLDNEGCGSEEVFTGRTAYCSGAAAMVTHPVVVTTPAPRCKASFSFGALGHNRKNGTARLQVKLPAAGSLLLFGKKVHAVTRKAKAKGSMFLTIHARVEVNKRLKKIHRTSVRVRVTFTPAAGCGFKTVHRSFSLLRAPKKHHHH
jgi:DNA-binding beta-propeller fold protein YncE